MSRRKGKNTTASKPGRKTKVSCCALITLDTTKIRKEYLKKYQRRKKVLDKLEAQLKKYHECDEPEFEKFLAQRFVAEQNRQRELEEQIQLCQSRYGIIHFLASECGISNELYCAKLLAKVTQENDFWSVLDTELQEFRDEKRKRAEEYARQRKTFEEENEHLYDDDDDDFGDWNDEYDPGESDEDEDVFKHFFDELFGGMLTPGNLSSQSDQKDIKKLYRELCLQYHPDKIGAHDANTQKIWISIQNAYQDGDLARLRTIHTGIAIDSGKTEFSCSVIDDLIMDVEWSIQETRSEIRKKKRSQFWGFFEWTQKQREHAEREIKAAFARELREAEYHLLLLEKKLERILTPKPKPNPKIGSKREWYQKAAAQHPDLFTMD